MLTTVEDIDETFTIAPPCPASRQARPNAWQVRYVPVRLTSITFDQEALVPSRLSSQMVIPAALTRMAGEPSSWPTSAKAAARASSLVTSTLQPQGLHPGRRQGRGAVRDVGQQVQQRDVDALTGQARRPTRNQYLWPRR